MAGGPLNYHGHYHTLRNVPIGIRPVQRSHPPIWYGTNRPDTAVWAARNGVNLATFGKAPAVRAVTDAYRAHAPIAAADAMPLLGMTRHVLVAETDAAAHALAAPAYARWFDTFTHLDRQRKLPAESKLPATFEETAATGECIAGSAATVRELLRGQVEEAGVTYLLCQVAFGDLPPAASLTTVAARRAEVMPAFMMAANDAMGRHAHAALAMTAAR